MSRFGLLCRLIGNRRTRFDTKGVAFGTASGPAFIAVTHNLLTLHAARSSGEHGTI